MDGRGRKEKEVFALSHVGFCWSSGRAPRAFARLQRQHESTAAGRRRREVLARREAPGRSDRIGAMPPRGELAVDADRAGWEGVVQEPFLSSDARSPHPEPFSTEGEHPWE
jgi:hypothetical protein